jgi:hypothetical protein
MDLVPNVLMVNRLHQDRYHQPIVLHQLVISVTLLVRQQLHVQLAVINVQMSPIVQHVELDM